MCVILVIGQCNQTLDMSCHENKSSLKTLSLPLVPPFKVLKDLIFHMHLSVIEGPRDIKLTSELTNGDMK